MEVSIARHILQGHSVAPVGGEVVEDNTIQGALKVPQHHPLGWSLGIRGADLVPEDEVP